MIYSSKGRIDIDGDMSKISAELILIIREFYKKLLEKYDLVVARSILANMVNKATDF